MALSIDTFDNLRGGNTLYKALTHPHAAAPARALLAGLAGEGPTAIVDPQGAAEGFAEIFGLEGLEIAGIYVQDVSRIGATVLGRGGQPITGLSTCGARSVLVAAFEADRLIGQLQPYLPLGAQILSLDAMRIPEARLTNRRTYLDPLNFATNFALFRDTGTLHTRLVTANYWAAYGSPAVTCWLTLFDGDGAVIAEWAETCGNKGGAIAIDSRRVREQFGLGEFAGQLFIHVAGAAGHDIVKYALDTFGDSDRALSCTHDANAWPADRYAGLPAPGPGERVILWVQNSHPTPIPAGAIGLNPMGDEEVVALPQAIGPFASCAVDVARLLPGLAWPRQIELRAGKHVVRPRYEVVAGNRRRIAHVNVERADLEPDPNLPGLAARLGKGYLLPAPILPCQEWESLLLPTPMAVAQRELPLAALVYDAEGSEIARVPLGRLPRDHATALSLDAVSEGLGNGYGHVELVYDFARGGEGDGWLHALFRYRHRASGHAADSSFGAHIFNTILTYKDEPQSYVGRPPGLSTRLFLRLGEDEYDTICHLIYPASLPWHRTSATEIILYDGEGAEIARAALAIPCSGSRHLRYHGLFDEATRARAGAGAYGVIRDPTCRLFGYHGLVGEGGAFSLDHMFGF
ncbi:MAG: ParB/RepB/Spo0J family partition protein [Stellaceae bacterium]